jgi:drug/metabolite transporter (DMT)-like permease
VLDLFLNGLLHQRKSMLGIILALLSAAASGFSVVMVGKHSKKSNAFNMSVLISAVGLVILWPLAIVLTDFGNVNLVGVAFFAVGGLLTPGLVRLLYYNGLKRLGTSVNSSIFSVYPLYAAFLAVIFLSEFLSVWNWFGVVSIAFGVVFVDLSFRGDNHCGKSMMKCLVFPVLGGLTLGLAAILRKYALDLFNAPVLGVSVAYTFSFLLYAFILAASKSTRKELSLRRDLRLFWLAGVGQAVAWVLAFFAFSLEKVSVVTSLVSVEPLFVLLLAYVYLREQENLSFKLVAGIFLTCLGVVFVTSAL